MGIVAIFLANQTLEIEGLKPERVDRYKLAYKVTGVGMAAVPVGASLLALLLGLEAHLTFVAELAGLWAIAAYWFIKTMELEETQAEILAVQGRLGEAPPARSARGPALPLPGLHPQGRRLVKLAPEPLEAKPAA
jgi:hypothetical protein